MQTNIEQALLLAAAGNARLRGRDVSGLWPNADVFTYTKSCEFRIASASGEGDFALRAPDPLAWFDSLSPGGLGFRLHHMERPLKANQMSGVAPRMLVGMVGGGPRWILEAIRGPVSEMWEGFDRLGDRDAPDQRFWSTTYVLLGETRPEALAPAALDPAEAALADVLPRIEAFALREGYDTFAACFARARAALDRGEAGPASPDADLARYTDLTPRQLAIYEAVSHAWVFGGMGSWNDLGDSREDYERLSEALFTALCDTVCGLANATLRLVAR